MEFVLHLPDQKLADVCELDLKAGTPQAPSDGPHLPSILIHHLSDHLVSLLVPGSSPAPPSTAKLT